MQRRGRRLGNYVKAVISIIFSWGVERGFVKTNPADSVRNVRRPRGAPEANRPWSDDERHAVLDRAPPHMRPAIALMMFTGLGPKDALALPRTFYKDGEIATRRSKTGEAVYWPAPQELREILAAAPEHNAITLCANSFGKPWTGGGFRASWRKLRLTLEAHGHVSPGLTSYGLRHTVAVIIRESGGTEREIADALGQKDIAMARHYAKGADLKINMLGIAERFDGEVNRRRTKVVKPSECDCKTASVSDAVGSKY
jgi:integrase